MKDEKSFCAGQLRLWRVSSFTPVLRRRRVYIVLSKPMLKSTVSAGQVLTHMRVKVFCEGTVSWWLFDAVDRDKALVDAGDE